MSYEGFDQLLYECGHYSEVDAMETMYVSFATMTCPTCKAPAVWYNCVDQTNDSGDEDRVKMEEKTPCQYKNHECKCCDKVFPELIAEATYHIPKDKGRMIVKPVYDVVLNGNVCEDKKCALRHDCANHYTAGEFREESGNTPNVKVVDDKIVCNRTVGAHHQGMVYLVDGVLKKRDEMSNDHARFFRVWDDK